MSPQITTQEKEEDGSADQLLSFDRLGGKQENLEGKENQPQASSKMLVTNIKIALLTNKTLKWVSGRICTVFIYTPYWTLCGATSNSTFTWNSLVKCLKTRHPNSATICWGSPFFIFVCVCVCVCTHAMEFLWAHVWMYLFGAVGGLFPTSQKAKLNWWICITRVSGGRKGRRRKTERKHESCGVSVAFGEEPFAPQMASHNMNFKKENVLPGTLPHSVCLCALSACVYNC